MYIFIVGVGRSGTSLLQSMIAANSKVCYLPETSFIRRYIFTGMLSELYERYGINAVKERLGSDSHLARTGIDINSWLAEDSSFSERELFHKLVNVANSEKRDWVGDKDPRLIEFLPLVSAIATRATVVNIVRDPRDVLLSKKKAAWSKTGHVWKHIFANRVQLKLGSEMGKRFFGENYYEIVYEDLLQDPERVLKRLCGQIGLSFEESMLNFGDAARKLVSAEEQSWKKETFGPLLKGNKQKWKNELSAKEILLTEASCKQALQVGRYKRDSRERKLSIFDLFWVYSGFIAISLLDKPYRIYRNYKVKKACKRLK